MEGWLSRARWACLFACLVVLVTGCLPDTTRTRLNDCSFGAQASQGACQVLTTQAQCTSTSWHIDDHVCTGRSCAPVTVGNGTANKHDTYCGAGSIIGLSASADVSGFTDEVTADVVSTASTPGGQGDVKAVEKAVSSSRPVKTVTTATIDEFALPAPGMQPSPIILSGQKMLFAAAANCQSPASCPNSGVFSVDTSGKVAFVEGVCATGGDACRVTGLTPLADGGYCYVATRIVTNSDLRPDVITCVGNGYRVVHPVAPLNGFLAGVAVGYDGKIWYTDGQLSGIGRLTANDGALPLATYLGDETTNMGIFAITAGPDQAMWFTANYSNQVGRIDTKGYKLVTLPSTDSAPTGIVVGPDGNLWFTEYTVSKIGRLTPAGALTEFVLPTANAGPVGIVAGTDGALYFTEYDGNKIGRITTAGVIEEYAIPTANAQPGGIVLGPDGKLWFTEVGGNKIGRLTVPPVQELPKVVEFYNSPLDTYFITANAPEQNAIDGGSAGPGWSRTGGSFPAGGNTPVCRFYGSIVPGPNSHFYTADAAECQSLKDLQAATPSTQKRWNFESLDFNTTPAVGGACPANLVPVYRAYNKGNVRGIDSNHRITTSTTAIAEVVQRGWSSEGVVMCAPQ